MTEAEWLACDNPRTLLWVISGHPEAGKLFGKNGRPDARKWQLLGVACCRRIWSLITEVECQRVVDAVEAVAEKKATEHELELAANAAVDCGHRVYHDRRRHDAYAATDALGRGVGLNATLEHSCSVVVGHAASAVGDEQAREMKSQSLIVRCIFGNPFRPVAFSPAWRTGTAVTLARQMYESRDFGVMPILADALQDAGCEDEHILTHCRGEGPHVRGCWVVDAIPNKG